MSVIPSKILIRSMLIKEEWSSSHLAIGLNKETSVASSCTSGRSVNQSFMRVKVAFKSSEFLITRNMGKSYNMDDIGSSVFITAPPLLIFGSKLDTGSYTVDLAILTGE